MGWQYGSDPCDLIWRRPNSNGFDAYRIHMCMHRKLKTKFDSIKIGKSLDPYSGSKLYVTAIISTEKVIVDHRSTCRPAVLVFFRPYTKIENYGFNFFG